MPDFGFDDWLDAQLRNVQLPADFLSRLAENGPASESPPTIPMSSGPMLSVPQLPPASADCQMDAALKNVPVPEHLEMRLRRIARGGRPMPLWRQASLAAAVLLVLVGGATFYLRAMTGGLAPQDGTLATKNSDPAAHAGARPQKSLAANATPGGSSARGSSRVAASPREQRQNTRPISTAPLSKPEPQTLAAEEVQDQATDNQPSTVTGPLPKFPFPTVRDLAQMSGSLKQAINAKQRSLATLGAGGSFDPLPLLDEMEAPMPRGITPPRVNGYDLLFQLKHNEHPFASPAAHPDLASSKMPFTFQTASYDRAAQQLRSWQLPTADDVRVEDFLAAQALTLPPAPAGSLALHSAIAASPLADNGIHLVQLAVKAGARKNNVHPATRLVVVIDTSSRMQGGARFDTLRRGLSTIAAQLTKNDTVTLVGFAERPKVLLESASGEQLRDYLASSDLPQPNGLADLPAAIEAACQQVAAGKPGVAQRIVFLTAGRGEFDEAALERSAKALTETTVAGTQWRLLRLISGEPDAQLEILAEQGHGIVTTAHSAADMYGILLEHISGRPAVVASKVTLKMTFNPQVVTGYRLLGHEASTLTGPAANPLEVELIADQAATGMYEVFVKPRGDDRVATVELTWVDPVTGQARKAAQQIRRPKPGSSFSQTPAWFQHAVVAAKTAEYLRGSSFAPTSHPFSQILNLAENVDSQLASKAEFQQLLELVKQAEKLR